MRIAFGICLGLLFTQGCGAPTRESSMAESIHQILFEYPEATVGIAVRDLDSGLSFDQNSERVFHAASTMKVPVMIEVFRQIDLGRLSLADSIPVVNEFRSIVDGSSYSLDFGEDSDETPYGKIGRNVTIGLLVERMITMSSNLATNILVDLLSADSIQATIEGLGTRTMHVYRGVEDLKAFDLGLNNTATAEDFAVLLTTLARREAVSEKLDTEMLDILSMQHHNSMIPAGLPEGMKVAHKTGGITRIDHDVAIVYPVDKDPYVLVILIEGIDDHTRSSELGSKLTTVIHKIVVDSRLTQDG